MLFIYITNIISFILTFSYMPDIILMQDVWLCVPEPFINLDVSVCYQGVNNKTILFYGWQNTL